MSNEKLENFAEEIKKQNQPFFILNGYFRTKIEEELDIIKMSQYIDKNGSPMFTEEGQYDRSRLMRPAIDLKMPALNFIHLKVCDLMEIINEDLIPSDSYAILSQGSERNPTKSQIFHSDYDLNESNKEKSKKSIIVMVALEQNTKLLVVIDNQEMEVIFHTGSIFVAYGSLIHAGAGYACSNVRLHWYGDIRGNNRKPGNTYHLGSESISNIYRFFASVLRNLTKAKIQKENNKRKREAISERMKFLRNLQLEGSEIYVIY